MKLITCFKLVPEEQDIVVTPQRSLNFDRADAKISQFDLNAIEAATQLSAEGDEIVALTVGGSLLQNSKVRNDVLSRGPDSLFMVQDPQLEHSLPRDTAQALACAAKNIEFDLMLFGAIGVGYFIYGKKQSMIVPLVCGIALMVYPWFVSGAWLTAIVGIALMAVPYFVRY